MDGQYEFIRLMEYRLVVQVCWFVKILNCVKLCGCNYSRPSIVRLFVYVSWLETNFLRAKSGIDCTPRRHGSLGEYEDSFSIAFYIFSKCRLSITVSTGFGMFTCRSVLFPGRIPASGCNTDIIISKAPVFLTSIYPGDRVIHSLNQLHWIILK